MLIPAETLAMLKAIQGVLSVEARTLADSNVAITCYMRDNREDLRAQITVPLAVLEDAIGRESLVANMAFLVQALNSAEDPKALLDSLRSA